MRQLDPEGFAIREPGSGKRQRSQLVLVGPHHEWSGDGHDKLSKSGFPIWGIRDVWSGVWLGLWVLPNNRLKIAIGYLYLKLIKEVGGTSVVSLAIYCFLLTLVFGKLGMPIQMTTDCGSETGRVFGIELALRYVVLLLLSFPCTQYDLQGSLCT